MKKLHIKKHAFGLAVVLLSLTACQEDVSGDRLIGPLGVSVNKNVLIEDFTGQNCLNCPLAAETVHSLQQMYGADTLIAVSIHGGPMSISDAAGSMGLATAIGNEYVSHWGVQSFPKGIVDRASGLQDFDVWGRYVRQRLGEERLAEVEVTALHLDAANRTVSGTVRLSATAGNVAGHLQLWLTESGVQAYQLQPDGTRNLQYVHQHVLRANLTPEPFGTTYMLTDGTPVVHSFTYTLERDWWEPSQMALVAFFWNEAKGVMQVVEAEI